MSHNHVEALNGPKNPFNACVRFSPAWWNFISSTRIFIANFVSQSFKDEDFSVRVAMTAHELLENACRYSRSDSSTVTCLISVDSTENFVRIVVKNAAILEHVRNLRYQVNVVSLGDPLDCYVQRMLLSTQKKNSHLGLARIRYEGGAALRMSADDSDVEMEAVISCKR